jgi:hypothetical protein
MGLPAVAVELETCRLRLKPFLEVHFPGNDEND